MMPPRCAAPTQNADLAIPLHFIVADDDSTVSTVIARVIARTYHNAEISIVSNGQDALQEYEQHGANLIITDRNMPHMDGLALARCIRAQDAAIPIVLVSGITTSGSEAVAVGVTQILEKPFRVGQLVAVLITLVPLLPGLQH
jgi:CheY-like chemotaxis protein